MWDSLGHTSDKLSHIDGAGRQAGTGPEQSGRNKRKITRTSDIPLARIIAKQHFDQLCDNFYTIWQLSAGWHGERQWFRRLLGTWKLPVWRAWRLPCKTEPWKYNSMYSQKTKAYLALAWSQLLSGSRCPSPPGTCAPWSSGRSRLWHKLWSCPECCPGPPGDPCPPCV